MKIKSFIILWQFLFCSAVLHAQPREDGGVSARIVKTSPIVTSFVGWEYDMAQKKWAGYYNTLKNQNKRNNNKVPIKLSASDMSNCDNIISLQFKQ